MTDLRVLRAAGRPAVPWRNGGGATREVASAPASAGADGFDWRVSLAEIAEDGPFSAFPDVDRILTVVEGDAGIELTVDGERHGLERPFRPFAFPGDAATECRLLGGPVTALNLMTGRGRAAGRVEIVRDRAVEPAAEAGEERLLVVLSGTATLPAAALRLRRHDAIHHPAASAAARTHVHGTAAVITVTTTRHPTP